MRQSTIIRNLDPSVPGRVFIAAIAVLAWVVGHDVAYGLVGAEPDEAAHHYEAALRLWAMVAAGTALLAFTALVAFGGRGGRVATAPRPGLRRLAVWAQPAALAFVVIETVERSFAGVPATLLVVGLAVQLVIAVAAFVASRRVLGAAARAAGRLRRARPRRAASARRPRWLDVLGAPRAAHSGAGGSRAPPAA